MSCGCEKRQEWLNEQVPGLGDKVAIVANPVKNHYKVILGLMLVGYAFWRSR